MSAPGNRMSMAHAKMPRSSGVYKKRPGSLGGPPVVPGHRSSLSRQSNIYSKGGSSAQDPRSINDKAFQRECMTLLMDYLTTHGFNSPISSKLPSGKEIRDMIEFLFRQIDPSIVLGKMEDEVPAFFRNLNYPFQISKSALYAAGSPHSWPGLLAALAWLVNLLLYEEKAQEIKEGGAAFGYEGAGELAFFEYLQVCYKEFLRGNDEACAKLDEEFQLQFEDEKQQRVSDAEQMERSIVELQTRLHAMTSEPTPLAVLEAKKADFLNDIAKFTTIINNFQTHKEALLKKMEEKKEDLQSLKAETAKIVEENEALRHRIGSQQISVAGVEKMDKESHILDTRLHAVTKAAQDLQREAWDEEVQSANMLRELEDVVVCYNTGIARLKHMYPEFGGDGKAEYEIKVNSREEKPEDILGFDVKGLFKPVICAVTESIEKSTKDAREEVLVTQKKLYAEEVSCQEVADEVTVHRTQNKKVEAQYKARKEKLNTYLATKAAERTMFETILAERGASLKQMNKDADDLLKNLTTEYETKLKVFKEEMEREQAEVFEELQIYAEHKEYIKQALSRLEEKAARTLKRIKTSSQRT